MTNKDLRRAAHLLDEYATTIAESHTMDGVTWEPELKQERKYCKEIRALAAILRQGAKKMLLLALLLLTLGGCVHELKFLPQCDGEPAKQMPCLGMCQVRVDAKVPTVRIMSNALVIKDHTGQTRCQEVEG